jgi:hypothetical protein
MTIKFGALPKIESSRCKLSGEIRNSMQMYERHFVPELTHQRSGSSEFGVAVVLSWFGGRVLGDFLKAFIVRAQL